MTTLTDRQTPHLALDLREQFVRTGADLVEHDPRVALVLAEISAAQFDDLAERRPGRVINVGIREQLLVGAAAGLSLSGLVPIVHTFGSFLIERAWEQVKLDFGHQRLPGVLVGGYGSYDSSTGGRTHQAPGDVALLDTLDGWTVHSPGHPAELDLQLRAAVEAAATGPSTGGGRSYLRVGGEPNDVAHPQPDGRLTVLKRGGGGVVVAVGTTLRNTLLAVADLDVTVLYASTVRPFDATGLRAAVDAQPGAARVIMVEPYLAGTSAARIARALTDRDHRQLGLGVGNPELHRYGTPTDHERAHGLDPSGLRVSISTFLAG